jgi:hypothetical protein
MSFTTKILAIFIVAVFITESLSMPVDTKVDKQADPKEKVSEKAADEPAAEPAADVKTKDAVNDEKDTKDGRKCVLCSKCPSGQKKDANGNCRPVLPRG